jgi:hypothetical protein
LHQEPFPRETTPAGAPSPSATPQLDEPVPGALLAWVRALAVPGRFFRAVRRATGGRGAPRKALVFAALVGLAVAAGDWRAVSVAAGELGPLRIVGAVATQVVAFVVATAAWSVFLHGIARFAEGGSPWGASFTVAAYSTAPWSLAALARAASTGAASSPWTQLAGYYTIVVAGAGLLHLHRAYAGTVKAALAACAVLWTAVLIFSFRSLMTP